MWRAFTVEVVTSEPRQGHLEIGLQPRGDVYLDDRLIGRHRTAIDTTLDTGIHVIRVENRASREGRYRDTVRVAFGETVRRDYRFTFPPAPEPEPGPGEVRVGSRPRGASVYIDGELQHQKTNYTFSLPTGSHIIRATLETEGVEQERIDTVRVVSDSTHKVIFDFE